MGQPASGHADVVAAIRDIAAQFAQTKELDQSQALMLIADRLGAAGITFRNPAARDILTEAEESLVYDYPTGHNRWHAEARRLLEIGGADPVAARERARL